MDLLFLSGSNAAEYSENKNVQNTLQNISVDNKKMYRNVTVYT